MRKSPLIELLEVFTPQERAEFQIFVASPYFNRGEFSAEAPELLRFLLEAEKTESRWGWEEETRQTAYTEVFPDAPFVEGKLEKVMSVLHRLARLFISVHPYTQQQDGFQSLLNLAKFSRQRALNNRFKNTVQKLRERFGQPQQGEDVQFLLRQFYLEWEQYEFENLFNHKKGDLNIPNTLEALALYYYNLKIDLLNRFLLQQKVTHLEISEVVRLALEEEIVPARFIQHSVLLHVANSFLQVFRQEKPDKEQFRELVELMRTVEGNVQPDILKDYYSCLRSCCILLVNSGNLEYLGILFEIQKEHLQRGYFYYDQKVPPTMFQNIISVALRVKEYEWAYSCIQDHANRIVGDNEGRDYYKLNLANYHFYVSNYDEALHLLSFTLSDMESQCAARSLELKIYYEQSSELLPYKIDAFKMYLSRATGKLLPAVPKERNGNFVNLLHQLQNTAKGDQIRVQRLLQRIQAKTWVAHREWLIEKATELL